MMYMPDAIRAALEVMEAPADRLEHRNAFNITAMQLTPALLARLIEAQLPAFEIDYKVDPVRQQIADSWPERLDDSAARREWGWQPAFDAGATVQDMLGQLNQKLKAPARRG
jgi:nucleoside-diphosphate-sugar epimerase